MSYPVPRHAHSSSNDQQLDDGTWQPRRQPERHLNGFEEKFNELFGGKDGLPMYKDKPYNYASSKRRRPLWSRRRFILPLLGLVAMILYWAGLFSSSKSGGQDSTRLGFGAARTWNARREKVKDAFRLSWKAYEKHAWGFDQYHPVSKTGEQMVPNGMGWIIVDALDTMILMNLTTELAHAREWVSTSLDYDQDHDVNTFETTIRMLGGLLSAHYLSSRLPAAATDGDDLYLEKASDLANRLLGAYNSPSGIPYASINLKTGSGLPSHDDDGASSTAEAATLQLEMKYLAHLTGEADYWRTAENVIKVIDDNGARDGLVPIYIYADHGTFRGNYIRLGSRGDSYYEYLIKQYLQTSKEEPVYLELWDQALAGVQKHLITYSEKANLTILAERPNGLDGELFPKMDHLVCFMPGTIALGATGGATLHAARELPSWSAKQEAEMDLAKELMKTCWGMYAVTATGLSPEIAHFKVKTPAPTMADRAQHPSPPALRATDDPAADWRHDYDIHTNDYHNLQRPETVESLFYMWRITGDVQYREQGWAMFESFMKHTYVGPDAGYTSLDNVDTIPPPARDNMESFWLAETLKYFYLLFSPDDLLPLDSVVFNTEAHPLPRFEMGKLFKTGWTRKPRDKDGNLIPGAPAASSPVSEKKKEVVDEPAKADGHEAGEKPKEVRSSHVLKVGKAPEHPG